MEMWNIKIEIWWNIKMEILWIMKMEMRWNIKMEMWMEIKLIGINQSLSGHKAGGNASFNSVDV